MKETKLVEVLNIRSIDGVVPPGNDYHRSLYSKVQYNCTSEGLVTVLVPEKELEKTKEFSNKCSEWLEELQKENSVLAMKLARWHNIRLR
ncbi:hypothetical protein G9298_18135 [Bacillus thuringiensis]|nr:hypothetical protein G9298_18135 [Bacillus thuringiensis]